MLNTTYIAFFFLPLKVQSANSNILDFVIQPLFNARVAFRHVVGTLSVLTHPESHRVEVQQQNLFKETAERLRTCRRLRKFRTRINREQWFEHIPNEIRRQ